MKNIGIVGGGIGGLASANFLTKMGHKVKLFEQTKHFIPTVGAGISLSPNGQMVLNQLGYMDEFRPYCYPVKEMRTLKATTGEILGKADLRQIEKSTGYFLSGVKRAQLIQCLVDKLPVDVVQYNAKFQSLVRNKESNTITLTFEDKSTFDADFVIGADGIRSRVQDYVVDKVEPPHFTGYQAYYGTIHEDVMDKNPHLNTELTKLLSTFPSHSVVALMSGGKYFITFQIGGRDAKPVRVWAFLSNLPNEKELEERWDVSVEHLKKQQALHEMAATFIPQVDQMIKLTPLEHILHFGLYDRPPLNQWHKDNVVLLGDACHALPNSGGQGANMALEDSFILAKCLHEHPTSLSTAFQSYQDIRLKRTHDIVKMGQKAAALEMSTNPVISWIRDQLFGYLFNSGQLVKMLEGEIIAKCPVPKERYFDFKK